jgi:hypothetical protein
MIYATIVTMNAEDTPAHQTRRHPDFAKNRIGKPEATPAVERERQRADNLQARVVELECYDWDDER